MTVKTLTGRTVRDALDDARRIFGPGVVMLAATPASGGTPASVTVAIDAEAPQPAPQPAPAAAPQMTPEAPVSPARRYGYAPSVRQAVPERGATLSAPPSPRAPEAAPVAPAPSFSEPRSEASRAAHVGAILERLEAMGTAPTSAPSSATTPPLVAPSRAGASSCVILVGPAGAGRSTLARRLGQQPEAWGRAQAGVLVVAPEEGPFIDPTPHLWEVGVPAALVRTPDDLEASCDLLDAVDLLIVDTPALPLEPARAAAALRRLGTLLAPLAPVEVVFVVDATRSASTLSAETLRSFGLRPDSLAVTRADEAAPGAVAAWADRLPWPLRVVVEGPSLSDVRTATRASGARGPLPQLTFSPADDPAPPAATPVVPPAAEARPWTVRTYVPAPQPAPRPAPQPAPAFAETAPAAPVPAAPAPAAKPASSPEASSEAGPLLSPKEAAERLGVGERTVRNLIYRGEIPGAVKIGRQWRIPAADVEDILTPEASPVAARARHVAESTPVSMASLLAPALS